MTVIVPAEKVDRTETRLMPAFGVQVEIVGRIDLAAIVAAAPDSGSGDGEVDFVVVGGAALAFGIQDFHVDQRRILPVGLETLADRLWA